MTLQINNDWARNEAYKRLSKYRNEIELNTINFNLQEPQERISLFGLCLFFYDPTLEVAGSPLLLSTISQRTIGWSIQDFKDIIVKALSPARTESSADIAKHLEKAINLQQFPLIKISANYRAIEIFFS